jgi:glycosyltransferase involved in cell wall biosynthesis
VQSKLNVAVVAQAYAPVLGGAQRQVQALGPLLERRGISVHVVTRRPPGTAAREHQPGVEVHRVWVPSSRAGASAAFTLGGAWAARRLKVDAIYAQDLLSSSTAAMLAGAGKGTPIVAKVLSTGPRGDVDRLLDKPLGSLRMRAIARRAAAFVCLSDEVERELEELGVAQHKLFRIHNGVDANRFRPPHGEERADARARLGVSDREPLFLYCGRFATVKRLDLLLHAFAAAPGRLVLAGEGNQEPVVRELIGQAELAERVSLLGMVDDPAPLYRAADAYVSASSTEGMSGSVLEAMASALPVVALPASGMHELLGADAGIVAEEDTPAALAAKMRLVADDPQLRSRLGAAARQRSVARFSLEATADRLAELFAEVARGAVGAPAAEGPLDRRQ